MYSRNYYNQRKEIILPDKYDGTALSDKEEESTYTESKEETSSSDSRENKETPSGLFDFGKGGTMIEQNKEKPDKNGDFSALFSALPLKGILGGFGLDKIKMPSFDAEDLLVLGIALYFLFSKSGDKLIAIMLLILLFT